jgi:hypothetical protein
MIKKVIFIKVAKITLFNLLIQNLILESLLNNLESYLNASLKMYKYQQFLKELPFYDYNRYEGLGFTKQCYEYLKSKDR